MERPYKIVPIPLKHLCKPPLNTIAPIVANPTPPLLTSAAV